jgi:hypothetical protein
MKYLPPQLNALLKKKLQTVSEKADPYAIIWISRPHVPLINSIYLERQYIGTYSGLSEVSIAARRPNANREADMVYIAYCEDGQGRVLVAETAPTMDAHVWHEAEVIPGAVQIAVAFDGSMPEVARGKSVFQTEGAPWVFWIDGAGKLYGRVLGAPETLITLAESNAQGVSAIRGMRSAVSAQDKGLVCFMLLAGQIFYRQLIAGVWSDALPLNFGPAYVYTHIAAARTWDYRIALQAQTAEGKIIDFFSKPEGFARYNTDRLELRTLSADGTLSHIGYTEGWNKSSVGVAGAESDAVRLYSISPIPVAVRNVQDGGAWNHKVEIDFDYPIEGIEGNAAAFGITDSGGASYAAQAIAYRGTDHRKIALTYTNLNASYGAVTVTQTYTPGTVTGALGLAGPVCSLAPFSFVFVPQGLEEPHPPVPVSVAMVGAGYTGGRAIIITFDKPLLGDVTGLLPEPMGYKQARLDPDDVGASSYLDDGIPPPYEDDIEHEWPIENAFDRSQDTYWQAMQSDTERRVTAKYNAPVTINRWRWYTISGYAPGNFTFSAMIGGTKTQIQTGTFGGGTGWQEFTIPATESDQFIWNVTSLYGVSLRAAEIELYGLKPQGNELAFTVTGDSLSMAPDGKPVTLTLTTDSLTRVSATAVRLTLEETQTLVSVIGDAHLAYSSAIGNLAGDEGLVRSFDWDFDSGVTRVPCNEAVHVPIDMSAEGALMQINYIDVQDGFDAQQLINSVIVGDVSAVGVFTHVDDI